MGFSPMDGFFLSMFLAVCIVAAVVIRFVCYRLACARQLIARDDQSMLPRTTTPVIMPSQPSRHSPELPHNITDSPLVTRSGEVFTIYTFSGQSTPEEEERERRITPPPKYSLISDVPPKYEDLFPPVQNSCTSCKSANFLSPVSLQHHLHHSPTNPPPYATNTAKEPSSPSDTTFPAATTSNTVSAPPDSSDKTSTSTNTANPSDSSTTSDTSTTNPPHSTSPTLATNHNNTISSDTTVTIDTTTSTGANSYTSSGTQTSFPLYSLPAITVAPAEVVPPPTTTVHLPEDGE